MRRIPLHVTVGPSPVPMHVTGGSPPISLDVSSGGGPLLPPYEGPYEVEPQHRGDVVLETEGKRMTANVVVHEIPRCYGLITWNGSTLRVS